MVEVQQRAVHVGRVALADSANDVAASDDPRHAAVADAGETPGAASTSSGSGWEATELDRSGTHIAIVSVVPGMTTVTYTAKPGTHVVVGAPMGASGHADVSATSASGACNVTVTPDSGSGGYDAQPLSLVLDSDCHPTADPQLAAATPDSGGSNGSNDPPPGGAETASSAGCGCETTHTKDVLAPVFLGIIFMRRRRR